MVGYRQGEPPEFQKEKSWVGRKVRREGFLTRGAGRQGKWLSGEGLTGRIRDCKKIAAFVKTKCLRMSDEEELLADRDPPREGGHIPGG